MNFTTEIQQFQDETREGWMPEKRVDTAAEIQTMREAIKDAHYALAYVYNHGAGSCAFPFRTEDDLCSENRFHHVKDALDALKPFLP